MKAIFPTIIFVGSSLWGYHYGEIPFTGIRPPSSLAQRTLSSLQLAGSASIAPEIRIPKSLPSPLALNELGREQKHSFERVVLVLMVVNFGILVKLILYRNEDRASEIKSHYDQREHIERLLYLYAGTLPVIGNHILRQSNQKFAKVEESIQRLHAKFERFDSGLQDLEDLTNPDRIDEAMARWKSFHEQLKELPRETSKALSDIVRTLEASLETSETDGASTGED
ncbi:unnamed protein product [Penicillium manginii]